jgi:tRNA threonylcarbamoyladenosine biosynthesis protein TsaE
MSADREAARPPRVTASAAETEALAAELAAELQPGDVVLVRGEMGAGKTTFVRGACRALGVTDPITSPTFTIGRRYDRPLGPISHLDLHRLADLRDEDPGLLADYLEPAAISFVEWPEAGGSELAERAALEIVLRHAGGDRREVEVTRR